MAPWCARVRECPLKAAHSAASEGASTHFGPSDLDDEAEVDVAASLASTDSPVLSRDLA